MNKLGKTPARTDAVKFKLSHYLLTVATPKTYGHDKLINTWDMLGNDQYGDCVWAGAGHETMLWNKEADKNIVFDDKAVLSDYSAVTGFDPNDPSTDQGTDMQVAASYRRKTGVIDAQGHRHKVGAYLAITPGSKDELKRAMYLFSNVAIGLQFPASAMQQFNTDKNWTIVRSSKIIGGHYVPAVAYDSRYVHVVTWGQVVKASWGFILTYCDEALVYLSPEFLTAGKSPEGFDLASLNNDLSQL